jgi:hypothetical protein
VTGLALPLVARVRRIGGSADRIVGARGGVGDPFAGAGLPEVVAVQTEARVRA